MWYRPATIHAKELQNQRRKYVSDLETENITLKSALAKAEAERKDAVKAGDWARGAATNARGKLVVAEQCLRESRWELERVQVLARLISNWVPVSRPEWGEKTWIEKLTEMEQEAGVKLDPTQTSPESET